MVNSQRGWQQKLKKRAYSILGNKCQHCGEDDPIVLSVDHIEPIGKHRKGSLHIWSYIVKNPIKASGKYQLLCRNCNWKKMIQNNERKKPATPFAYKSDVEDLLYLINENKKLILSLTKEKQQYPTNTTRMTDEELTKLIYPLKNSILNDKGELSAKKMRIVFIHELGVKVGHNRAYTIKELLKLRYPNEFS